MKTDEFIRLCIQRDIGITNKDRNGWYTEDWRQFAKLTILIDYGCNFKKGICRNNRDDRLRLNGMGCCGGCAEYIGYLRNIPINWIHLIKMARLFNKRTGFWRKGRGCALPHELRSSICLDYMCSGYNWALGVRSHQKPKLSQPAKRLLKVLDGKPPKNIVRTYKSLELALKNDKMEV